MREELVYFFPFCLWFPIWWSMCVFYSCQQHLCLCSSRHCAPGSYFECTPVINVYFIVANNICVCLLPDTVLLEVTSNVHQWSVCVFYSCQQCVSLSSSRHCATGSCFRCTHHNSKPVYLWEKTWSQCKLSWMIYCTCGKDTIRQVRLMPGFAVSACRMLWMKWSGRLW